MSIRFPVLTSLLAALCLSAAAQARDPMPTAPPANAQPARGAMEGRGRTVSDADIQQQELLLRQKRRDDLRSILRVQSEEGSTSTRQLSAQEKMELRQQLRQQQEWLSK